MYVKEGVTSTKEMKRLLKIKVKESFNKLNHPIPEPSSKRFHPRNSTIRNHIMLSRRSLCRSIIAQECLQDKIKEWKDADPLVKIFFRPKCY